jgi:hypothetical protein
MKYNVKEGFMCRVKWTQLYRSSLIWPYFCHCCELCGLFLKENKLEDHINNVRKIKWIHFCMFKSLVL